MARKQVSFRRNGNVEDESPSALSVASEGTAGFLSISQTRMLLSMVDDNSVFSSTSGDETGSESETATSMPVNTSTSSSTATATRTPTQTVNLLPEGNESLRSSGQLRQSKKDLMRSLLEEYGLDGDLSSTGDSFSQKSTNDQVEDHNNNSGNDNERENYEIGSHIDSESESENDESNQKPPAKKVTPQESETTCETASDDSEHDQDQDQESLQLQAGPLQPTSARQTPNKSVASPLSHSPSLTSTLRPRNDSNEQFAAVQDRVPPQTSTPKTPNSKRQIHTNPPPSSRSSTLLGTDHTSHNEDQEANFGDTAPHIQPVSTRSAYEIDPFASPMSTDSSDFHIRKINSDIESELAEAMMDIPPPPHVRNDENTSEWQAESPPPTQTKADSTETSVVEGSDEDSVISISSDEGFLDRAVRRRSNRQSFRGRSSSSSSRRSTRMPESTWKVKVPTRRDSFGSKSKTRKSVKQRSPRLNQSIPVMEFPKTEQMESDDGSSVESPLPEETSLNEPSEEFFEEPIKESLETKRHEAIDSYSDDDSPILLINPRTTEQQLEVELLSDPFDEFVEEPIEENLVETKQPEALVSDRDNDSPIELIKPRTIERQPESSLLSDPLDKSVDEPSEENLVETKQPEALVSDSDDDSPIKLIKPRTTERQPESSLRSEPLDKSFDEPIEENLVERKQPEALGSDSGDDSPIELIKPRTTERQPEVFELEKIKLKPADETKVAAATTTSDFALTSKTMDVTPTEVKSPTTSRASKAHDPPGAHGMFGTSDAAAVTKKSSSEINKVTPAESNKSQTPVKQTVKQGKTAVVAKKPSKTSQKKPKRENIEEVKSTLATSTTSQHLLQESHEDTIMPLNDAIKKSPQKATKTKQKAKETKSKPNSNVKSKKAKSRVGVKKVDPEPDKLPPYELSYQPSHQDDDGSPYPTRSSSMRSIDSDGIWRPPKNIPGLHGAATDLNSPDRSTTSLGFDDVNLTHVEWKSFKAPFVKAERQNIDTTQGSSSPQTPDLTSDRQEIGAKSPVLENQFSTVELNAITLSGNRSEASTGDHQATPGGSKRIGRFMKWTKGDRNEATRRFSNESFKGDSVPSRTTLGIEDVELQKTPKAAKSKTLLWPTIPRIPSVDKNLSGAATDNTLQTKTVDGTKKIESPRINAKLLPESYPSMQSPDREMLATDPSLDVITTPKKPKSSSWLPWARKSPKMKHAPVSVENKPKVDTENPASVTLSSRQGRLLTVPPFGLSSGQRRPKGRESLSIAEQREERRVAYIMDRRRRQAIKIQAVTRGYLIRKKFPRPRQRAKPPPKGTQMGTLDQTRDAAIEPSPSMSPKPKSQGEASDQNPRLPSQRNMKPALQSYQQDGKSDAGRSVAEQREARRLAYQLDQQRRCSIVIQSALRGYMVRKKLGLHEPRRKNLSRSKPQDPPVLIDQATLSTSHQSGRDLREIKDNQKRVVAPKTPEPVTPKKGLRWLPWAKKRDGNTAPPIMDKNTKTSELSNIQRFDASLYLRKRMYHDEQESQGKSLDEIREARRQMYLRDLERREAIKIQSLARGFLLRRELTLSRKNPIIRRQSKVKSAEKAKSSRSMTLGENDAEEPANVPDSFDRAVYLTERLQRDEAQRRTKSVAEVRLERQQIYIRDLQRREATRIQAVWRGHQARKRYPGFTKRPPEKCQPVNDTTSAEKTGTVKFTKAQDGGDDENSNKSGTWMKLFFFGKSKEAPSDNNLPVVDELEPEPGYEAFDPYADTDDFFGFSDPKYKERTGFFSLDKPRRTYFEVPAVSEDARNWKGRTKHGSNVDFDKVAYMKERKAREEFEKQSATLASNNAARRETAQKDLERRGALRIQTVARGYIARKKNPLPKTKRFKESQNAKHPMPQQRPKKLVTEGGKSLPGGARKTSERIKKKENKPSAYQGNRSTSSVVKNSSNGDLPREVPTRQSAENSMQLPGTSTKARRKVPSKATSTSIKGQSTRSITDVQQGEPNGEKDWEIVSGSEILSEGWSEEIIEEVVLEDEEVLHGASTSHQSVAPNKLSMQGANVVQQCSQESNSKDDIVDSNAATTSQGGDFVQTDNENKPRVHSGSTYSTDVGDSWWLPSIGTEDTRTYRQEIYVPDSDLNTYYRRPAPKHSTTTYWEAVRTSYLPSVIDSEATQVVVPPVLPFSRTNSTSTKLDDLGTTSSVQSEESWLPPQNGEIVTRTIPHGNTGVGEETDPEGWVPAPSKPQPNPKRVDFAGTVQKGESFRWAPHLPSPSKRENKRRIELLMGGDQGGDTLICDIQESIDIERGIPKATQNQMIRTSRTKNRRIMVCVLFFFVLLAGGGTAAYFLWEDPPWEKWVN